MRYLSLLLCCLCFPVVAKVIEYDYKVEERQAQPRNYFVQGLEYNGDSLLIGTGGYGQSTLYRIKPDTGDVLNSVNIHPRLFGEGITALGDRVYQLTWRARTGFIYALSDFKPIARFRLNSEGWGLCNNGRELILSDGSHRLYRLDPNRLSTTGVITVTENGKPLRHLNELEWIDGKIWANVWMTDDLVIIDPSSGEVEGRVHLTGLLSIMERQADTDVLNGIAWDAANKALWVTGKNWPWRYRIRIIPKTTEGKAPTVQHKRDNT